ncbi:RCC1 and BTB domain-containing protein 1 [Dermatophagoides pteronyssinus]|uniref:RCC1 and BTB domain-containing protein 1 n=1 Tax=Dermatophagoides pteronyssinus TaxID=6956 RepID=A0ABQ8IUI7_DERPT|nr:RCC1 and BTB domain-containing protein 1 [Dermatophagoides pteronyssinus]
MTQQHLHWFHFLMVRLIAKSKILWPVCGILYFYWRMVKFLDVVMVKHPINDNEQDAKVPTKIPIENVQSMACKNYLYFSLALDQSSHYYEWASAMLIKSPITFGLTSTIYTYKSNDPISFIGLLDNPDNYDIEFVIDDKRIFASKCHLKILSKYYSRMFSGDWQKKKKVIIKNYSYDTYYSYLRIKYKLDGMNDKLVELTIKDVLPKNKNNITKFLEWFYEQQSFCIVCITFYNFRPLLNIVFFLLRTKLNFQEKKTMKIIPTDTWVDIELFQNDLKDINPEFIPNIVSIFKITNASKEIGFLFMTNNATYVYGDEICKWLSLQHDPKRPQQINILNGKKIIQVDSGNEFVVVLTDDGLVYLASGDSRWQTNNTFRLISNGNDRFEMIACGQLYLLLLRQDGTVFALGNNLFGQLTGNSKSSYDTVVNTGLNNVKIIACGLVHSLALTNTNEIYSWGWNNNGQLGLGDTNDRRTPSLVSFPDGSIDSPIKNIVAGAWHSLFLLEDGQIFGCGYGQPPINDNEQDAKVPTKIPIENVQNVACKNYHLISFALDHSSHYYEWGRLQNKELLPLKRLDGQLKSFAAASVMVNKSPITYGLTSTIYSFESNDTISNIGLLDNPDNYDVKFVIDDKRILACKCYLKMSSEYYSRMFSGDWQENDQVIIKDYSYYVYYSYLRMLHTGRIRINQSNIAELIDLANCYGDEQLMKHCKTFIRRDLKKQTLCIYLPLINKYQLDTMHDKLVELTVENILPKIADNLLENKENINEFLELLFLSDNHFFEKDLQLIIQVDSGKSFVVVLTDDGQVYLASDNSNWQTNNTFRLISTGHDRFEMIACGQSHFLLLRQDGTVFALGDDCYRVLTSNSDSHDTLVNIGLNNIKIIACGLFHCLALTDTNQIYSWGWNGNGQLGLGDTNDRTTPSLVSFPDVSINSPIKNIVGGWKHSLFLFENGQIFGCGYGQRSINDNEKDAKVPTKIPIENVQSVVCKNHLPFSLALDQSSCYYVWGTYNYQFLPLKKLDGQLKSFVAASAMQYGSPITFGLTSTIEIYEEHFTISNIALFNNPDNYDIEFVFDDKRIMACKCYLKMASKYYSQMFSGDWQENDQVIIKDYSYDTYYSYLLMLHTGDIRINRYNIAEFIDLANCYGHEQLIKHCQTFIERSLNKKTLCTYLPLINKYELKMQNKLIQLTIDDGISFLFIANNNATYAYGRDICKWLSLKHDPKRPQQINILNDKKIIQIDSCYRFVVVLTDDGQVYLASEDSIWKTKNTFKLISTGNDRFEMISCGQNHLLLLRIDGTVFALGDNRYGQLTGNSDSAYVAVVNTGLNNVKIIACGGEHSLALTNTNEIYSWGWNEYGQLGLGDTNNRRTPSLVSFPDGSIDSQIKNIMAGSFYSLFLLEDGQIFGCGYGQPSINDDNQDAKVPAKIPIENVQSMACKNSHLISYALDHSSHYYQWGRLYSKKLAPLKKLDGQPKSFVAASIMSYKSPITFGLTSTIYSFESHDTITNIGLLDNPDNYDVEFVIGDKRILARKCYLKMSSKYYNRMFSGEWLENDQVIIKDYNYDVYYSYLLMLHTGRIRINQSNIAILIDLANCYGDERLMKHCKTFIRRDLNKQTLCIYLPLINKYELDDMHDKLVQLTTKDVLPKIAYNLLESKEDIKKFLELNLVIYCITNNATYAYGDEICKWLSLKHDPKRPQQIDILNEKKIIQVDSGNGFVVVLTDDGLVYLASSGGSEWRTNNTFRLISTGNDRFEMIACGQHHLLLLRQDGTVFALGYGQLTGNSDSSYVTVVNTGLKNVKIIACGEGHSLALTNTNQIYSWGYNNYGQLGLGDTNDRRTPSLVSFPDGSIDSPIKNIVAGANHSLFLLEDGQIFGCVWLVRIIFLFHMLWINSSHYYAWGRLIDEKIVILYAQKLDGQLKSFVAASVMVNKSPITFGLTSTIYTFE